MPSFDHMWLEEPISLLLLLEAEEIEHKTFSFKENHKCKSCDTEKPGERKFQECFLFFFFLSFLSTEMPLNDIFSFIQEDEKILKVIVYSKY